jgi:hypothetical protein
VEAPILLAGMLNSFVRAVPFDERKRPIEVPLPSSHATNAVPSVKPVTPLFPTCAVTFNTENSLPRGAPFWIIRPKRAKEPLARTVMILPFVN